MKVPLLLSFLILVSFVKLSVAETRIWTNADGVKVEGEILSLEADTISLKTSRGTFEVALSKLSPEDQEWARQWAKEQEAAQMRKDDQILGAFDGLQLGEWPKFVMADFDEDKIQIVKEDKEAEEYIYRSPHFEFRSPERLSKTVIVEFSRIFEATFQFAKEMPIGLNPQPFGDGHYLTILYRDRDSYYQDGGMPGSGGMHSYRYRGTEILASLIKVPLTSLGVEWTGVRYKVDHQKRSDTLTHEIAHQVTGRWLPLLPVWVKEGLAETIAVQPYDNGRFRLTSMDRAIRDNVARYSGSDREFNMVNLEKLMTITSQRWAAELAAINTPPNYPSANVLFYYFVRLDGEGDGAHFVNYLKSLAAGEEEVKARNEHLLRGQTFKELEERVAEAWRSEGLRLEFY